MDKASWTKKPRLTVTRQAVFAFLAAALLCAVLIMGVIRNRMDVDRVTMEQLILEKSGAVSTVISRLLYKTQVLAALAIQSDGEVADFERVAEALVDDDAILNVLLAPGGVVSRVYPLEGNEGVLGLDFFQEGAGNIEARLAKETGELVFGGPFTLVQGGQALVGRLPVWKETADGDQAFWGIVSVTLKYPEALEAAGLESIANQGLAYEIWRINPDDNRRQVIGSSPSYDPQQGYIEKEVVLLNAKWYFRIAPVCRWYQYAETWLLSGAAVCMCSLAAYIVESNARLKRMKRILERQEVASRKAARTAEEASRMKSTFLATVSHEIRTPMNGIIGFSDLAMEDTGLSPSTREYLANIGRSAKGLMRIIDDLLDISKIEAGKVELESIPFTVQKVLEECITTNSPKAMEKGLALHVHADPRLRDPVMGDPTRLRQILLNLLSNAIKFTGIGAVEVTCRLEAEDESALTLAFSVKDSGIGMSKEQIARVGESFVQADSSTTRKYGGTGLGLSISKNLVELMGGQLRMESVPGIGSRFFFTLRLNKAEEPALPEESGRPGGETAHRPLFHGRVLVCEDTPANQELIREHLSRAGLRATVADNGRDGLELARKAREAGEPYDLIFMDIQMPVMDGVEAARTLLETGNTAPVVAMTANVMASDRETYREAGMEECLAKPFSAADLRQILLRYLQPAAFEPLLRPAVDPVDRRTVAIHRDLGLRVTDGDEDWYQRLLLRFTNDNADTHQKIAGALRRGDAKQARRLAHSLKSTANMIGAARLASAAARVEQAVEQGEEPSSLEKQMVLLKDELDAVLFELQPAGRR